MRMILDDNKNVHEKQQCVLIKKNTATIQTTSFFQTDAIMYYMMLFAIYIRPLLL